MKSVNRRAFPECYFKLSVSICAFFNSWIRDSVETSCCGHFGIWKLRGLLVISRLRIRDLSFRKVRIPSAIVLASIVAKFIVLTRLFRHLLNWNGLRMFQISAKINFKTKYEGFSNRPCTEHNEEQRESRRVSEWQSKLRTRKFQGNTYSWDDKNVNL